MLITKQQPIATDLRMMIAALKLLLNLNVLEIMPQALLKYVNVLKLPIIIF